MSHRYWIVTTGHTIKKRCSERPYPGLTCFGWPKMELGKSRYETLHWGHRNGPPWRKNGGFGVSFEDLLLDIIKKSLFLFFHQYLSNPRVSWSYVGSVWKIGEYWAGPPTSSLSLLIEFNKSQRHFSSPKRAMFFVGIAPSPCFVFACVAASTLFFASEDSCSPLLEMLTSLAESPMYLTGT